MLNSTAWKRCLRSSLLCLHTESNFRDPLTWSHCGCTARTAIFTCEEIIIKNHKMQDIRAPTLRVSLVTCWKQKYVNFLISHKALFFIRLVQFEASQCSRRIVLRQATWTCLRIASAFIFIKVPVPRSASATPFRFPLITQQQKSPLELKVSATGAKRL